MTQTPMTPMTLDWMPFSPQESALGHDIDMLDLFWLVKSTHEVCYFFESVSHPRHQDRFHVIGFDPAVTFTARGQSLTLEGRADIIGKITGQATDRLTFDGVNPYDALAQLQLDRGARSHQGGLIGFFCHEAMNYFEPSLALEEHAEFEPFKLGLYLDGIILDTVSMRLSYYTYDADRTAHVQDLIARMGTEDLTPRAIKTRYIGDSETEESFTAKVAHTQEKICQGYSFQAEVGMKSFFEVKGDKFTLYRRLREVNPSPYMFYVQHGAQELFGASPEILISSKSGRILTTPTAGTRKRGKDAAEDVALARELLSDPKEIAEHNMLVDLHRNDVSIVSMPGTVVVEDLMYLIKFSHVQHIVSNVVGVKAKDKTAFDVLKCILPGGVVTGAPKIETVKIIDANESAPRGPYGGAVGRFAFNGDCDFCLPIRSLFCVGDRAFAQTSAGVVYDSKPAHEYHEVQRKLDAMRTTLAQFAEDTQ